MEDIYEKIENMYYALKLTTRFKKTCENGHILSDKNYKFCPECGAELSGYLKKQKEIHDKKNKENIEYNNTVLRHFKKDCIEYCGLNKHRKKDKVYEMAWERYNSVGLSYVVQELEKLAELILYQ